MRNQVHVASGKDSKLTLYCNACCADGSAIVYVASKLAGVCSTVASCYTHDDILISSVDREDIALRI